MTRMLFLAAVFTSIGVLAQETLFDATVADVNSRVSTSPVFKKTPLQPWLAVQRRAHETVWQSVQVISNSATREVQFQTNAFIEMGGGLNVLGADGQYVASDLSFEITARGAEARRAAHRMTLPANINAGTMLAEFPDGTKLEGAPLSFGFYDPVDGRTVVLGTLTDSIGWLVESNVVVYSNCFSGGIRASIRFRNNLGGPSQDLLIHDQLPDPQEAFGLSSGSRLEMFTELLGETPVPQQEPRIIQRDQDAARRAASLEPDFMDAALDFGGVRMAEGRAFTTGGGASARDTSVGKVYYIHPGDNRRILIEAVEYQNIRPMLTNLPPARADGVKSAAIHSARVFPVQRMAGKFIPDKTMRIATLDRASSVAAAPAFVLDYETVSGSFNNYVFAGNKNYLVAAGATVTLTGTTVVEGGAVIKYGAGAVLDVTGPITFQTSRWQPAVFTCRNDDTVGEAISTGAATQMGTLKLNSSLVSGTIKHVQFRYATEAIRVLAGTPEFRHLQFVSCTKAFTFDQTAPVYIGNALFHNVTTVFDNDTALTGEHLTLNNCGLGIGTGTYLFRNSVFSTVGSLPSASGSHNGFLATTSFGTSPVTLSAPAFQTVGAGAHYLAASSVARNAGTAAINTSLLSEIAERTTYPPLHRDGGTYSTDWIISPSVPRDNDGVPDRGYHYEPLDALATQITMNSSAVVIVTNGASLGIQLNGGSGISLQNFATFVSQGSPISQNFVGRAHLVQEQPSTLGAGWMPLVSGSSVSSSIRFRHTILPALAGGHHYFYGGAQGPLEFTHCELKCGLIWYGQLSASPRQIGLTNNLFLRSTLTLGANDPNVTVFAYNNLFVGGVLSLNASGGYANSSWLVKDCVFDKTLLSQSVYSLAGSSHNGYVSGFSRLAPQQSSDRVVASIAYTYGQRGEFFVSDTSSFENNGSRTADSAGLRHFTIRSDQQQEGGTIDLGLHHLARNTLSWLPQDTDADAIPDFIEDPNGNGVQDIGEESWRPQENLFARRHETLGPSSRRTPLVISEIMYNPASGPQFIELYNTHYLPQDISGFGIYYGDANFTQILPANTVIQPGAYFVVLTGLFNGSSDTIRLQNKQGAVLLEVQFSDDAPWPLQADGAGHSLVLANPSYGENDPRAWAPSRLRGGSPGAVETNPADLLNAIRINEFLANPVNPARDFIELYNASNLAIDIGGCVLSCSSTLNPAFTIPAGTIIAPRGFISWTDQQSGIGLSQNGEAIYLASPGTLRVLDGVRFANQAQGISTGRSPDGAPTFNELTTQTPGAANSATRIPNIVINEIMFNPISGDDNHEYIEIFNRGGNQSLSGWSLRGGIDFPSANFGSFILQSGAYVIVAKNKVQLAARYPVGQLTDGATLFGNYSGSLANSGDRITLVNSAGVVVDEVTYGDGGRWTRWADGDGASLELVDVNEDNRLAPNWADSAAPNNAPWTTVEFTGTLIQGDGVSPINALEIILLGEGECVVDNVEVIAGGVNRISNGSFTAGASGWTFEGTHDLSAWSSTGGDTDPGCVILRATGPGEYLGNRVLSSVWSPALAPNSTATLRARVRWLRGHSEIVLRLRGNYLEAAGTLTLPSALGSPGLVNSPIPLHLPAITEVTHDPALPQANEPVLVTARVQANGGGTISSVLRYRIDPSATLVDVTMRDDGTGGDRLAGDGILSASLPGQPSGTLVAFRIEANNGVMSRFPVERIGYPFDTERRECLVRFGEAMPVGTFGSYRFWLTQATINEWNNRAKLHKTPLDTTFVYGGNRVVYNARAAYSGSDRTTIQYFTGPLGSHPCHYKIRFAKDDRLNGSEEIILKSKNSILAELQYGHLLIGQLDLPTLNRRFVHLHVNGVLRGFASHGAIYEDTQSLNGEFLDEWYPAADQGDFFKFEVWFRAFNESGAIGAWFPATLQNYLRPDGSKNVARYRWIFQKEQGFRNDYATLFSLVDAVAPVPINTEMVEEQANMENWMRTFAAEKALGNTDSYGFDEPHNMYGYKPPGGLWHLNIWDIDYMKNGNPAANDLFDSSALAPEVGRMLAHPPFRRAFLRGLKDAATGPMQAAVYDAFLDPTTQALAANGFNPGVVQDLKTYFAARRAKILSEPVLQFLPAFFAITSNGGNNINGAGARIVLEGTAPVEARSVQVSGATVTAALTWVNETTWNITLALQPGANTVTIQGLDRKFNPLSGYTDSIVITR